MFHSEQPDPLRVHVLTNLLELAAAMSDERLADLLYHAVQLQERDAQQPQQRQHPDW